MNKLKVIYNPLIVDTCLTDGVILIQMSPLQESKTYAEYCSTEITGKIKTFATPVKCLAPFDIHERSSCKSETREVRGRWSEVMVLDGNDGVRSFIKANIPVYAKFNQVIRVKH